MDPKNTNTPEFLFKRPEAVPELGRAENLMLAMGAVASRLVGELRTRCEHPDGRRENVSEHENMLAKVAPYIAQELYPWLDRGMVSIYSTIHDDPETYAGDTPTDNISADDLVAKAQREELAIGQLSHEFGRDLPGYLEDIITYEQQQVDEARFTRIMDKFMVLLIHIPNQGRVLRATQTYEQFVENTQNSERRLLTQYPEWIELIEMRTKLAMYIGDTYIRDWKEPTQT